MGIKHDLHVRNTWHGVVFAILILALMLVTSVFNYFIADYESYEASYNSEKTGKFEFGYEYLETLALEKGLSFADFRAIYLTIACFLTFYSILRITKNCGLAILCYFVYPFLLDMVQMRHFMAFSIVLLGIVVLRNSNINFIIRSFLYLTLIVVASTQHVTAFAYVVLLLCMFNEKTLRVLIPVLFVLLSGLIVFKEKFLKFVLTFLSEESKTYRILEKIVRYYSVEGMYQMVDYIRYTLLSIAAYALSVKKDDEGTESEIFIRKVMLTGFLLVAFMLFNANCNRFHRSLLVFYYIGIYNGVKDSKKSKALIPLMLAIYIFIQELSPVDKLHWTCVTRPAMQNNYIFAKLYPVFEKIVCAVGLPETLL